MLFLSLLFKIGIGLIDKILRVLHTFELAELLPKNIGNFT